MEKRKRKKLSLSDRMILGSGYVLLGIFILMILIPLVYVVIASFMDPITLNTQGITFDFSKWSLEGYKRVLEDDFERVFKFCILFRFICSNISSCYTYGSISIIKRRFCW